MGWASIGWLGQACFFARFLVQWWQSERRGTIVVPAAFWWLSLAGSVLTGIYALVDRNLVFLAGPCVTFFIYARNVALLRRARRLEGVGLWGAGLGLAVFGALAVLMEIEIHDPPLWLLVGGTGQALWLARFVVQWIASERRGRPLLPSRFFDLSLAGSLLLLVYAIHDGNPVWIAGMLPGPLLYARSVILSRRAGEAGPSALGRGTLAP